MTTNDKLADALRELSGKWRAWAEELKRTGQAVVPNSYKAVADELDAALAEHDAKAAADYVLVPRVPTEEMWEAWRSINCAVDGEFTSFHGDWGNWFANYAAMLAAAPDAPAPVQPPANVDTELPPLPPPFEHYVGHGFRQHYYYAADQMHAYARAAIAALQQPGTPALPEVTDEDARIACMANLHPLTEPSSTEVKHMLAALESYRARLAKAVPND